MIRARLTQLQLAVMLLTRLPVGRLADPVPGIAQAAWAFPIAGALVGAIAACVMAGALALGFAPQIAAGLGLTVQIVLTGALHEDGIADVTDGFWGGRDVARRLEIMRDSRIGSYGTLALVVSVGLRWQALVLAGPLALCVAAIASRAAPVLLMAAVPPARGDGMGSAARDASWGQVAAALGFGLIALAFCPGGWWGGLAALVGVAGLGLLARRRIGGQTGDVLGAGQQVAEIAILVCLSRF